jgi:hypothetical protein
VPGIAAGCEIIFKSVLRVQFTICVVGVWLLSTSPVSSALPVNQVTAQEPQLRAAVILGVLRFTSWSHHDGSEKYLDVCTVGDPVAAPTLLLVSKLHKVVNKTLLVRNLDGKKNIKIDSCDVLVFGAGSRKVSLSLGMQHTAAHPVLTICDGCKLPDAATTIKLIQIGNRIGFEVNLENANIHGINLSSSLLELASEVRR